MELLTGDTKIPSYGQRKRCLGRVHRHAYICIYTHMPFDRFWAQYSWVGLEKVLHVEMLTEVNPFPNEQTISKSIDLSCPTDVSGQVTVEQ